MAADHSHASHWDQIYEQGDTTRSWYQAQPTMSLRMLKLATAQPNDSLIDIGGGATSLAGALLEQGLTGAERGRAVVGIDGTDRSLEALR